MIIGLLIIAACIGFGALLAGYFGLKDEVRLYQERIVPRSNEHIARLTEALHKAKQDAADWERHLKLSDFRIIVNDQEFPVYKAMGVVRPYKDEHITKASLVHLTEGIGLQHVRDIEFPFELTALAGDTFKLPMTL